MFQTILPGLFLSNKYSALALPRWLDSQALWSLAIRRSIEDDLPSGLAILVILGSLLYFLVPAERKHTRAAAVMFVISSIIVLLSIPVTVSGRDDWGNTIHHIGYLLGGFVLINLTGIFFFEVLLRAFRIYTPRILRDLLLALAYITFTLVHLSTSGVNLSGIVATSAVLTAVIGFSLQDTLGNIMGGLALQMERSINVGDWIRIDPHVGRVVEISWRQTTIETRNWDTVIIPNSQLMKGQVVILGRRTGQPVQHRQHVYFQVDFRFPPSDVMATVEAAVQDVPIARVATDPKPNCVLLDFKDSTAFYDLRYWLTDIAADDPTDTEIRTRIYFALKRASIPLSIPAQSLFLTSQTRHRKDQKLDAEMDHRVKALGGVELFDDLTEEERKEIAGDLRTAPFRKGEIMTRQGAVGHWLYIIIKGSAEVQFSTGNGLSKTVARLEGGQFFGEMSLMTGEPRTATVIALEDVECYRLDKESFRSILIKRPEMAEHISHILAKRRVELEAIKEGLDAEAKRQRLAAMQTDILSRIRRFFRIGEQVV
ncbi:MAG TPA: mechanosensitive ion channel family protein [Blastocatellia bacterium]|nr:mechanosensitive ion channel family protein [Blastocatellia bacterium]